MGDYLIIVLTCQGQDEKHEQRIAVEGYDLDGAKDLARILDGTHELYITDVRADADCSLAHCQICGAVIDATVEDPSSNPVQEIAAP